MRFCHQPKHSSFELYSLNFDAFFYVNFKFVFIMHTICWLWPSLVSSFLWLQYSQIVLKRVKCNWFSQRKDKILPEFLAVQLPTSSTCYRLYFRNYIYESGFKYLIARVNYLKPTMVCQLEPFKFSGTSSLLPFHIRRQSQTVVAIVYLHVAANGPDC